MSSRIPIIFSMQVDGDAEVKSKFEGMGDSAEQLGEKTEQAGKSAESAKTHYLEAATGIAQVSIAAFELWNRFDDLQKIELRIMQAEKSVDSSRARLLSSQATLTKLTDEGVISGTEYEQATLRMKAAEQELEIAQERVRLSQGDLSEAHASFALGILPTSLSAVVGLTEAYQGLKGAHLLSNIQTAISEKVFKGATLGTIAHRIATSASTLATHGLVLATKLLHLAMGPIGLIIIGVTTFLGLFATNAFGVRDAINQMGKAIGDAIPLLRPLLDALATIANTIFPQAEEKTEDFGLTTMTTNEDVMASYAQLQSEVEANTSQVTILDAEMAKQHKEAFESLQKVTKDVSTAVSKSLDDLGTRTEKTADRITSAAKKAAAALRSLGLASSEGSKSISVKPTATGFSGMVTEPTLFLAGEAGPETVNISPVQASGRSSIMITVVTQLDGREVARTVSRVQGQSIQ